MPYKPNDGKHIEQVVDRVGCSSHKVYQGSPCWDIFPDTRQNQTARAVCGSRIRAAGFIGQVSEAAAHVKKKLSKEVKA